MNLEYLNQNSLRSYPIQDGASRVSSDGLFVIPNSLIVDVTLSASGVSGQTFYISSITNLSTYLSIEISVGGAGVFGTFSSPTSGLTSENTDIPLVASAGFPDALGIITIGTLDDLELLPSGIFQFSQSATQILSRCSTVGNAGVTGLTFVDATGTNFTLTGHVTITANSNLQFVGVSGGVQLNAGENLGLNKQCATVAQPVLTINGVTPDSTGNFNLIADPSSCISISDIQYGSLIADSCGKPCLGCTDIQTLTNTVNGLEADIYALRDFTNNLQNLITQANALIGYQCLPNA